ncbi:MAG TPA: Ig domain-containing protein [Acidimicrobiales bacterium]|nr:Ig domain-containing protein [Acidimicrobiales bacterium]
MPSAKTRYTATGQPSPTFAVTSGTLFAGLGLNSASGVLSGTPTTAGTTNFTVTASNGVAPAATSNDSIAVAPADTPPAFTAHTPPAGTVAAAYTYTYTATGQPSPTFAVTSGTLPAGLGLNSASGVLSGNPTTAGTAKLHRHRQQRRRPRRHQRRFHRRCPGGLAAGAPLDASRHTQWSRLLARRQRRRDLRLRRRRLPRLHRRHVAQQAHRRHGQELRSPLWYRLRLPHRFDDPDVADQ